MVLLYSLLKNLHAGMQENYDDLSEDNKIKMKCYLQGIEASMAVMIELSKNINIKTMEPEFFEVINKDFWDLV